MCVCEGVGWLWADREIERGSVRFQVSYSSEVKGLVTLNS